MVRNLHDLFGKSVGAEWFSDSYKWCNDKSCFMTEHPRPFRPSEFHRKSVAPKEVRCPLRETDCSAFGLVNDGSMSAYCPRGCTYTM